MEKILKYCVFNSSAEFENFQFNYDVTIRQISPYNSVADGTIGTSIFVVYVDNKDND